MTITLRNTIWRTSLWMVVLMTVAAIVLLAPHLSVLPGAEELEMHAAQRWLMMRWSVGDSSIAWMIVGLFVLSGFAVTGSWWIIRAFRKTTAPEMLFFAMFILALGLDIWKLGHVVLFFESFAPHVSATVSRIIHFGRFFGMICVFISTLYLTGIEYQQTGVVLNITALIALTVVYTMPVDHLTLLPNLTHRLGDELMLQVVMVVLQLLAIANVIYAVAYQKRDEYLPLLLAIPAAIVGREMVFFLPSLWGAAVGFVLLASGAAVVSNRLYRIYLWK